MFLHIGADIIIPEKNIVAILDMDSTTASKDSREFLRIAEKKGFIETISDELPKTIIITNKDKQCKIYMSPISSATLLKRTEYTEGVRINAGNNL